MAELNDRKTVKPKVYQYTRLKCKSVQWLNTHVSRVSLQKNNSEVLIQTVRYS